MGEGEFEGMLFAPAEKAKQDFKEGVLGVNGGDLAKEVFPAEFRQFEKGEFFSGNMPVLAYEQTPAYIKQIEEIYGPELGVGKWSRVLESGERNVAKIFKNPNFYSFCEFVFMKRFGGMAGLPEFRGATINGYGAEKIHGKTISDLVRESVSGLLDSIEIKLKLSKVLTVEQAQSLLDQVAEYHKTTKRVHGDLVTSKGAENIMLDEEGKVRILDTEWERVGSQTPKKEIDGLYEWLTENFGIDGLVIPDTISDEEAVDGLNSFLDEVEGMIQRDATFGHIILGFKEDVPEVKIDEKGYILIRKEKVVRVTY